MGDAKSERPSRNEYKGGVGGKRGHLQLLHHTRELAWSHVGPGVRLLAHAGEEGGGAQPDVQPGGGPGGGQQAQQREWGRRLEHLQARISDTSELCCVRDMPCLALALPHKDHCLPCHCQNPPSAAH